MLFPEDGDDSGFETEGAEQFWGIDNRQPCYRLRRVPGATDGDFQLGHPRNRPLRKISTESRTAFRQLIQRGWRIA